MRTSTALALLVVTWWADLKRVVSRNMGARPVSIRGCRLVCGAAAVSLGTCATAASQSIAIGFPIAGQNPYTAPIITVLDHSADTFYDKKWKSVLAYTGELGKDLCGNGGQPCGYYNGSYSQTNPVEFIANGNYVSDKSDGVSVLNYRGHSGYDYNYAKGTTAIAAADGDLYVPAYDPVNTSAARDPYCDLHTFYIRHGSNGWTTWYLHTSQITVGSFSSTTHGQCSGEQSSGTYSTSDTFVAHVTKGEAVAVVGDWASGEAGGVGPHLHFEVRRGCDFSTGVAKGCKVVDPYGWEWDYGDPIDPGVHGIHCLDGTTVCSASQSAPLWSLSDWGVQQPVVTNVSLTGSSGNYTATISGQNFSTNPAAQITLWDQNNQYWVPTPPNSAITSLTSTQIVVQLPISTPTAYALKIINPTSGAGCPAVAVPCGPRSVAVQLGLPALSSSAVIPSIPLVLDGQPAPGGGTIVTFGGFESFNNRSEAIVSVGIDTNNDGVADTFSDILYAGGSLSAITAPPFTKISDSSVHILRNNNGDIAFADLSSGEPPEGIWVLPNGATSPTWIIDSGTYCSSPSPCAVSGQQIYTRIWGPLAFDDSGDVAFESSLYNIQTNTTTCCYLFAYYASTGSIVKVVAGGDPTPIGGTFSFVEDTPVAKFTADGDVIFDSQISGGPSSGGIFRFSLTQGISKLVAQGDNAPSAVGGTFGYPEFGHIGGVSGRQLVFDAPISGGLGNQLIGVITNVTASSSPMILVAYQGEQTQTTAGGSFSFQFNSSYLPFGHYGIAMPWIRSDGQVVFYSNLTGAVASNGASAPEGIFIWNGSAFQKLVVDGDQVSSGQTVSGVSEIAINDHGEVLYFAAKVQ